MSKGVELDLRLLPSSTRSTWAQDVHAELHLLRGATDQEAGYVGSIFIGDHGEASCSSEGLGCMGALGGTDTGLGQDGAADRAGAGNEGKAQVTDINALLAEREKTHGRFEDHAAISQELKRVIVAHRSRVKSPDQMESLEMIAHKVARILNGNPNEPDHWRDIAGYATLVANRLERSV